VGFPTVGLSVIPLCCNPAGFLPCGRPTPIPKPMPALHHVQPLHSFRPLRGSSGLHSLSRCPFPARMNTEFRFPTVRDHPFKASASLPPKLYLQLPRRQSRPLPRIGGDADIHVIGVPGDFALVTGIAGAGRGLRRAQTHGAGIDVK
jgi:hypothetical protein